MDAKHMRASQPVWISVGPAFAELSGPVPAPVLDALSAVIRTPTFVDGEGYTYRKRRELFVVRENARLLLPSGLVPRIVRHLRQLGIIARVDEFWDQNGRSGLVEPASGYRNDDHEEFAEAIARNPRGQIVARSNEDADTRIAWLAELFADQHVVAVAANRSRIRRIGDRVRRVSSRPAITDHRRTFELPVRSDQRRFLICSPQVYSMCQPDDWQVVIFADQESLFAEPSLANTQQHV